MSDPEAVYVERNPASRALHERARRSLAGGTTRTTTYFDPFPVYLTPGEGRSRRTGTVAPPAGIDPGVGGGAGVKSPGDDDLAHLVQLRGGRVRSPKDGTVATAASAGWSIPSSYITSADANQPLDRLRATAASHPKPSVRSSDAGPRSFTAPSVPTLPERTRRHHPATGLA